MTSKKKTLLIVILTIAVITLVLSGIIIRYNSSVDNSSFRKDLECLSRESYDSVFLSMHSSSGFNPEIFMDYSALNPFISSYEIQTMDELQCYLEKGFSSDNVISRVYLLLDPAMIQNTCEKSGSDWDHTLQKSLFAFSDAHPDVPFRILLPYPALSYWTNMDQPAMEATLSAYYNFVEDTYEHPNIRTFFMGFEKWLLTNPDNYVSDFDVNDVIAKNICLSCFCDQANQITPINAEILFDLLREQVIAERTAPTVYPDLSDCCFIFFGDSIMAYGEGSLSTPGYITGLSHAAAYNYAVGGTPAEDFPNVFSYFLSEECVQGKDGTYRFSPENEDISDKKLYIFLLYGANDYFNGNAVDNPDDPYDTSTYAGVLRNSLNQYMPLFPDAQFILITPGYTSYFLGGTARNSDVGGVLTEYVEAAVSVAEEFGLPCIDNYHGLGINASNLMDYSSDGCHPNEDGRLLMAEHIIEFVDDLPCED